jgi:hypothetical protein
VVTHEGVTVLEGTIYHISDISYIILELKPDENNVYESTKIEVPGLSWSMSKGASRGSISMTGHATINNDPGGVTGCTPSPATRADTSPTLGVAIAGGWKSGGLSVLVSAWTDVGRTSV